ncbi:MAG: decaprenyl-phosphate phosphoribosyltransferase [Candidatus Berkelbacteria bacterium]|nr:decaprenyl-phosphate phosphoribosyltransferase [Candidatus Berkelbacteria bacterium]
MIDFLRLLRPKQLVKNLLIFAPLLFAFKFESASVWQAVSAFLAFSLFASAIYVLNDIFDFRRDRFHPTKKFRPIAAKKIKVWQAFIFFALLLVAGTALATFVGVKVYYICLFYLIINLFYTFGLKHLPIVDVMIISLGYVLRVIAGALAINVSASHWLLLCTFFISLFLAFGKRKNEMLILSEENKAHRRSISEYTESFIDQMLALTAGISVVFYALYTIDPATVAHFQTDRLIYTTPLVVFGIFRYFHLIYNRSDGGDPVQVILGDKQLIMTFVFWLGAIALIYSYH